MKVFSTITIFLAVLLLEGCTMTVGGNPILGLESEKDKEGKTVPMFGTVITQHVYNPQIIQSPPSLPGTPPLPPVIDPKTGVAIPPGPVAYQALVYKKTEDPTLRTFVNQSSNVIRLQKQGEPEIRLLPYQSSADIAFAPGNHPIKITIERPTANFGTLNVVRSMIISVKPEDSSKIIYLF